MHKYHDFRTVELMLEEVKEEELEYADININHQYSLQSNRDKLLQKKYAVISNLKIK